MNFKNIPSSQLRGHENWNASILVLWRISFAGWLCGDLHTYMYTNDTLQYERVERYIVKYIYMHLGTIYTRIYRREKITKIYMHIYTRIRFSRNPRVNGVCKSRAGVLTHPGANTGWIRNGGGYVCECTASPAFPTINAAAPVKYQLFGLKLKPFRRRHLYLLRPANPICMYIYRIIRFFAARSFV